MKKRLFALALAGVLAAATLTGCGSLKGDETVATVDDTKIDADLANFFARYTQATYETYYSAYLGEDKWNSDASDGEHIRRICKEFCTEITGRYDSS